VANGMLIRATRPVRWISVLAAILAMTGLVACKSGGNGETAAPVSEVSLAWLPEGEQPLPGSVGPANAPTGRMTPGPASGREASFVGTPAPSVFPLPADFPLIPTPTLVPAESPPVRLVIPSIELDAPVVPIGWHAGTDSGTTGWDDPGPAVGWLRNSALPGRESNVVLAGHHNVRGEVFRRLIDMRVNDSVCLVGDETVYCYRVTEHFIVPDKDAPAEQREQNGLWIAPTIDERLTLVTCWPHTHNTHRLIVVARPAGDALAECVRSTPHLVSSKR
jgi:sortase A